MTLGDKIFVTLYHYMTIPVYAIPTAILHKFGFFFE